jgi:hypothetical protein
MGMPGLNLGAVSNDESSQRSSKPSMGLGISNINKA